jgi:hypothetical protein
MEEKEMNDKEIEENKSEIGEEKQDALPEAGQGVPATGPDTPPPPQPRQPMPPPQPYYYQSPPPYPYYYAQPPSQRQPKKRSDKPTVAGALLIIVGILGLIFGSMLMTGSFFFDMFQDFPLEGTGTMDVHGEVVDVNGTGISGVTITVSDSFLETTTDSNGMYQIVGVSMGYRELT